MAEQTEIISSGAIGIDVSKWQGEIHWDQVASNATPIDYAYIKVSEGTDYRDPMFRRNMANAKEQAPQIQLGGYHFARVSRTDLVGYANDARMEAETFAKNLLQYVSCWTLPPMLDIEWDERTTAIKAADIVGWCETFTGHLDHLLGAKDWANLCGLYTQKSFWHYKMADTQRFNDRPLWLAGKGPLGSWPVLLNQYTSKGTVHGIQGGVDMNRWVGGHEIKRTPGMLHSLMSNMLAKYAGIPKRAAERGLS